MKAARFAPLALLLVAAPVRADKMPACVRWSQLTVSTSTGYNHVVAIENGCDKSVSCTVTTDVAPEAVRASVPSKGRVELTTFRGSPSRSFRAAVTCSLD
jgi:hypothetical protein